MRRFVEDYVRTCDTCCRAKMPRHHPYGLLEPLPIQGKPWQSISLDFITNLPDSKGFNAILTVVDRYTKMAHFLPCTKEITRKKQQKLLCVKYFSIMVFPIVSSVIVDHNLSLNFGSISSKCSRSPATSLLAIIAKQMVK